MEEELGQVVNEWGQVHDDELSQMLEECSNTDWRGIPSEQHNSELEDLKKKREGDMWTPFGSRNLWPEGVKLYNLLYLICILTFIIIF